MAALELNKQTIAEFIENDMAAIFGFATEQWGVAEWDGSGEPKSVDYFLYDDEDEAWQAWHAERACAENRTGIVTQLHQLTEIDPSLLDPDGPETEIRETLTEADYEVIEAAYRNLGGEMIVCWSWNRYTGYARELHWIGIADTSITERDLYTGNEDSVGPSRVNFTSIEITESLREMDEEDQDAYLYEKLSGLKLTNMPEHPSQELRSAFRCRISNTGQTIITTD